MQPRPIFPQGGMRPPGPGFGGGVPMMRPGAGMFGSGRPMMGGARQGMYNGGRMMMGQGANPFGGMMGGRQMGRGGGLLSRLFGRGNQMGGMMGTAGRATGGGGLLQSLSNPSGIMNMLNNTQQLIKTAQTVAPMVQQYGPLVRSLPGLWKIYRGLKNSDESAAKDESSTKKAVVVEESSGTEMITKGKTASRKSNRVSNQHKVSAQRHQQPKGKSVPKLYI